MEILDEYKNMNVDVKKSENYLNKLTELGGSINLLLDDFKDVYIMYKMYPENEEIQQRYIQMTESIEKIQSDLFSISNNIDVDINALNKKLVKLNILIREEKNLNREIKRQLGIVESTNESSYIMINNYKEIYNIKYLRNWALFLSLLFTIYTINIVFRKKPIV